MKLLPIFFALLPLHVVAESLPSTFINKSYLSKINWNDLSSLNNVVTGWKEEGSSSANKNFKLVKSSNKDYLLEGMLYKGSLSKNISTGKYRVNFFTSTDDKKHTATKETLDYCNKARKNLSNKLGAPANYVNVPFNKEANMAQILSDAYWDIGSTRVNFGCTGLKVYDGYIPLNSIVIAPKEEGKIVKNLVRIKCDRSVRKVSGDVLKSSPITMIIDENRQKIHGTGYGQGDTIIFNDEKVVIKNHNKSKKIDVNFSLDRIAGSYRVDMTSTEDKNLTTSSWGNCSLISSKKKF